MRLQPNVEKIAQLLIREGRRLRRQREPTDIFTGDSEDDRRLSDLKNTPHLFVFGCILGRQIIAHRAWAMSCRLADAVGDSRFAAIERLTRRQILRELRSHRFPPQMTTAIQSAIQRIRTVYGGDASRIWRHRPSSALVVLRFLEFDGVGPKIATMAANILARHFKVPFSDYHSIDISVDVHVRRVLRRLGLVPPRASTEHYIYRARSIYPAYPGLLDRPVYLVGRHFCRPRQPRCPKCFLRSVCPTAPRKRRPHLSRQD